jgi:NAD(P)H-dependent FMN reductase
VLAVSGSLRAASINSALLRAAPSMAPPGTHVAIYEGVGRLPLYNPDLEERVPAEAAALRAAIAACDALLIASPEYAHGVTGAIKNMLDWLVSDPAFAGKRVAVVNTSPRAHHADAALRETLRTMAAVIVQPACVALPLLGSGLDADGMAASPAVRGVMHNVFTELRKAVLAHD